MAGERSQFYNVHAQTEATFNTTLGAQPNLALSCWNLSHSFTEEALDDETARTDLGEYAKIVGSMKASTFGFDTHAAGLGTAADDGVTATATPLSPYLLGGIGTEQLSDGDISSAVTSSMDIDLTDAAAIITNTIAGFQMPSGTYEWRPVVNTAGTLVPVYALSVSPTVGHIIYGTASYQMVNAVVEASSLQAQVVTDRSDEKYLAMGCFPTSIGLSRTAPGELPVVSLANVCASWTDGETDPLETTTANAVSPWMDSEALIIPFGTTVFSATYARKLRSIEWTLDRQLQPTPDPNSAQGLCMWEDPGNPILSLNVTVPIDDQWRDDWTAAATVYYTGLFTFGSTPGKTSVLFVRKMHLMAPPETTEDSGIMAMNLQFAMTTGAAVPQIIFAQG